MTHNAFNNRSDFYNLCLQTFDHQPWQVVLAHGKRVEASILDAAPPNFMLAPFVPQLEVLQRSSVFVTHGGMNSVLENLFFGVPVVVAPQMIEQRVTAQHCVELGLGITLDDAELTAEKLRAAVDEVNYTVLFLNRQRLSSNYGLRTWCTNLNSESTLRRMKCSLGWVKLL